MKKRKMIGLVTTSPESVYQQRVLDGVLSQCRKYGYDVAVFSTLVNLAHYFKDYLHGEENIYDLINFDMFDGMIVTAVPLCENNKSEIFGRLLERFRSECRCKVVSIDLPFGEYDTVYTDDAAAFSKISDHIYNVHNCKNVYFLTGYKGYEVSEKRLGGYKKYLDENGIPYDESKIFYGDFWYSSGEKLADDIAGGTVPMPDAVICASDHMAIGLANRLSKHGIDVPGQVIVTGYDATQEAILNDISITTYEPEISAAAAKAVDMIHSAIEPDIPEKPIGPFPKSGLRIGQSCGCEPDVTYMKQKINDAVYNVHHNDLHRESTDEYDISLLLDSYMYERLVNTSSVSECIYEIYKSTYLIHPYDEFFLCLKENWLDLNDICKKGYPKKMRVFVHSDGQTDTEEPKLNGFCDDIGERSFETRQILPEMFISKGEPSVFYFSPVHFNDEMLGYTVLKCGLAQEHKIGYVFRNWIRYVNSALETARTRAQLFNFSMCDAATGLYNRRGMYSRFHEMKKEHSGKKVLVIMADMDGLKYINDTFGHSEGDFGIYEISGAVKSALSGNEIGVRSGGDEFLIIGAGDYTDDIIEEKLRGIERNIRHRSLCSGKPYEISASIGFYSDVLTPDINIDTIIGIADERMYEQKKLHHKERKQK